MKKLLSFIIAVSAVSGLCTSCGSSDEPAPAPEKPNPSLGNYYSHGGFFTVIDGDTIEITDNTLTIPQLTTDFTINVYSNGILKESSDAYSENHGLKASLVNPIESPSAPGLEPVQWPRVSCMASSCEREDSLLMHPIFKQTFRITPHQRSALSGQPRSTVIQLSTSGMFFADQSARLFEAYLTIVEE